MFNCRPAAGRIVISSTPRPSTASRGIRSLHAGANRRRQPLFPIGVWNYRRVAKLKCLFDPFAIRAQHHEHGHGACFLRTADSPLEQPARHQPAPVASAAPNWLLCTCGNNDQAATDIRASVYAALLDSNETHEARLTPSGEQILGERLTGRRLKRRARLHSSAPEALRLSVRVRLQQQQQHEPPQLLNMRNASSWPFQMRDCHIRNHSPPTSRKATSHISSESVSAATATRFPALKAIAGPRNARTRQISPHHAKPCPWQIHRR